MKGEYGMSFLDIGKPPLIIDKPIRLIELFAGIGAQAKALENIGVPFEHYRVCEIDRFAVASYNAVHGTNFRVSDITKITAEELGIVDTEKYTYIMTYSFPCQDLSNAGRQAGMTKGSGTRSGLLWEVERLLNETEELPQILLMENVPAVVGEKNMADFSKWVEFLESKGYSNRWQILNAKGFGVPQNRERCFMVSWLGDYQYEFPEEKPLTIRLKDVLEEDVDEKYYLSQDKVDSLLENSQNVKVERERERERRVERSAPAAEEALTDTNGILCGRATRNEINKVGVNVGTAILARDYKGLAGKQVTNIAIEYGKTDADR